MRLVLVVVAVLILGACTTAGNGHGQAGEASSWRLVYENDAQGQGVAGSKAALIEAIKRGKPIRVYTAGRRIEHASEARFLSIFQGEVFAQLSAIESQRPQLEPLQITFRQPGQKWRSIVGSNGFVTAYMDGNEPNIRTGRTRWFVQD